jgi:alkylation response protein AidB-like acyl-CoA dehydrogenase
VSDLEQFRAETRDWLGSNCPQSMRSPYKHESEICWGGRDWRFESEDQRLWLEAMSGRGWTAPSWPTAYGGGGLDRDHAKILKQELARINARPALYSFGISMLGPAMLKFGSEQQKQEFLPTIVRGEIRWCQGYSEPNAGSDLASLQTRCEHDGEHLVLNGSKVWTSYADKADWMFCLVRTEADGPKHGGISFVLFDMQTPGVSTSPIKLISGRSPFCETHMENVRIPLANLMGEENQGWTIAKYVLTHEREMISGQGLLSAGTKAVNEVAREKIGLTCGQLDDPVLRTDISRFEVDEMAFALTLERARDEVKAGVSLGAVASLYKYYGTELNKARYELLMAIGGLDALEFEGEASQDGLLPRNWLRTKGNSIEGGTSEIMLNIVSKRVLGLPG